MSTTLVPERSIMTCDASLARSTTLVLPARAAACSLAARGRDSAPWSGDGARRCLLMDSYEKNDARDGLEARVARGDEAALAALFSLHRPRLARMVEFRLEARLRARMDADDILQDAYLNAVQRIRHFAEKPGMPFFLWLRTIVEQTLIDLHRRHVGAQQRDARREVAIQGHAYPQATSTSLAIQLLGNLTSPSEAAARAEMTAVVEQALEQMNPIDREVLALRHFEELTNAETAQVLGIEQKAASIRYVRALARLKAILADVPGAEGGGVSQ